MIMENKTERAVRIIWYSFCVIIAAISIRRFGIGGRVFTAGLFLLSLALAGAEDIRTMYIPDWITAACGAAGLLSIPFFPEISLGRQVPWSVWCKRTSSVHNIAGAGKLWRRRHQIDGCQRNIPGMGS